MKKILIYIYLLIGIVIGSMAQNAPEVRFHKCTNCPNAVCGTADWLLGNCDSDIDFITNDYSQSMNPPNDGFIYDIANVRVMQTSDIASDFGRRGGNNSKWHQGVDISSQNASDDVNSADGNDDAGDHILPIEIGTVTGIYNFTVDNGNHYKVMVVQGEHIFGYGHIFFDVPQPNNNIFPELSLIHI